MSSERMPSKSARRHARPQALPVSPATALRNQRRVLSPGCFGVPREATEYTASADRKGLVASTAKLIGSSENTDSHRSVSLEKSFKYNTL